MKSFIILRLLIILILAAGMLICIYGYDQEVRRIRFMFYNVENLFDTEDDPGTEDEEFNWGGIRGWNHSRYKRKLNSIYKAVVVSGEGSMPAVCGLFEVENMRVLEDLLRLTPFSKNYSYDIIHEESNDPRGIDVCLLYRKDILDLVSYKYFFPDDLSRSGLRSRSVLYTKWNWCGETFHLLLNHWPSRRGGVAATEESRLRFASMVRRLADSITAEEGDTPAIIIAGDLNCNPEGPEEKVITGGTSEMFVNLLTPLYRKGKGTYKYNGIWDTPDQVIVSRSLLDGNKRLFLTSNDIKVIDHPALLVKDNSFPGYRPYSTYYGFRYQGGFSDHLPVVIDLNCRSFPQQVSAPSQQPF